MLMNSHIVQEILGSLGPEQRRWVQRSEFISMIGKESWDFNKKLKSRQIQIISKIRKQILINQLRLSSNRRPQLISQISGLHFSRLTMLDLGSNCIVSIEPLCQVKMPCLERLNLYNNLITEYKSLRRCHFPKLIYLTTQSNPSTNNLYSFSQIDFKQMLWLWLEHKDKMAVMGDTLIWLIKCQMPKLQECVLKTKYRMELAEVQEQVRKKYNQTKIYFN